MVDGKVTFMYLVELFAGLQSAAMLGLIAVPWSENKEAVTVAGREERNSCQEMSESEPGSR